MNPLLSLDSSSTESDVFYVERSSEEGSRARNITPASFNSTQLSGVMAKETITFSSVASPEPQIVTIDSDSNEATIPYEFGSQHPIVPPSINDLNMPPNPFNVLATMAVIRADEKYSRQSPEPFVRSQTFFMWSAHRKEIALSGTIPRQSSFLLKNQERWEGKQSQYPPSPLRNHEL